MTKFSKVTYLDKDFKPVERGKEFKDIVVEVTSAQLRVLEATKGYIPAGRFTLAKLLPTGLPIVGAIPFWIGENFANATLRYVYFTVLPDPKESWEKTAGLLLDSLSAILS